MAHREFSSDEYSEEESSDDFFGDPASFHRRGMTAQKSLTFDLSTDTLAPAESWIMDQFSSKLDACSGPIIIFDWDDTLCFKDRK